MIDCHESLKWGCKRMATGLDRHLAMNPQTNFISTFPTPALSQTQPALKCSTQAIRLLSLAHVTSFPPVVVMRSGSLPAGLMIVILSISDGIGPDSESERAT